MYYRIQCTVNNIGKKPITKFCCFAGLLSRPVHWPEIVLSSDKVESNTSFNVENSMQPGLSVDELFGMGLLRVSWICSDVQPGRFVVKSFAGETGIANNCTMEFDIQDDNVDLDDGIYSRIAIGIPIHTSVSR